MFVTNSYRRSAAPPPFPLDGGGGGGMRLLPLSSEDMQFEQCCFWVKLNGFDRGIASLCACCAVCLSWIGGWCRTPYSETCRAPACCFSTALGYLLTASFFPVAVHVYFLHAGFFSPCFRSIFHNRNTKLAPRCCLGPWQWKAGGGKRVPPPV